MKILSERHVDGVAVYRDSSEIPAFVVMDWIEGPSLQEAVEARAFRDWNTILRTAKHLTRVIRNAHELPERVLHRDLRPSNVMLRDFYSDPDNWKVMVLDFDLSWHLGAEERSVVHGSTLYGYLAPEQIMRVPGVSTRHSAVDSFGLGMVMSSWRVAGIHFRRSTGIPTGVKQFGMSARGTFLINGPPCRSDLLDSLSMRRGTSKQKGGTSLRSRPNWINYWLQPQYRPRWSLRTSSQRKWRAEPAF